MDIARGFQIDNPDIFVPWGIDEKQLSNLFSEHHLKLVTKDYFTAHCTSMNGLNCMIGFHFEPGNSRQLMELEFFRTNYDDQKKSFDEFQNYFENVFGRPTRSTEGSEGFNNYEWLLNSIRIIHFVYDRFGPEEHMRVQKLR